MNDAEERAWEVVRRAYEERDAAAAPARARTGSLPRSRRCVAAAVVAAVALAARARRLRARARGGRRRARRTRRSSRCPARGRLLVVSRRRRRHLARRATTASSGGSARTPTPRGRRTGSTSSRRDANELAALDARRRTSAGRSRAHGVALAGAGKGTRTDTRIAYLAASGLRVVAGDGTGDHLLDAHARRVAAGLGSRARCITLAYCAGGAVVAARRATGTRRLARAGRRCCPTSLDWSTRRPLARGRLAARASSCSTRPDACRGRSRCSARASCRPRSGRGSHALALSPRSAARRSEVRLVDVDRPGRGAAALRRPGRLRRRRLVAGRPLAARRLADREPVGVPAGSHVHAVGEHRASSSRAPTTSRRELELPGRWCCAS